MSEGWFRREVEVFIMGLFGPKDGNSARLQEGCYREATP